MQTCYKCGDLIEFFHDGLRSIPVHQSGSCGSGGWGNRSGWASVRTTSEGICFDFPFVTYESYLNPNARCPVCGASVFFYQSPYGGRVFFDELGPPWPKHPCTDHPQVREEVSTAAGRIRLLVSPKDPETCVAEEIAQSSTSNDFNTKVTNRSPPTWFADGWMPFIIKKLIPRRLGIEAIGQLFTTDTPAPVCFRIVQSDIGAQFLRQRGILTFGYSLIQNTNVILAMLNEAPIFLRRTNFQHQFELSSLILTNDNGIEVISCVVDGYRHQDI
jgi:hypothetical protein